MKEYLEKYITQESESQFETERKEEREKYLTSIKVINELREKTEKLKKENENLIDIIKEITETQIEKLTLFIINEVDGEPSQNEGAGDCAIRIIRDYQEQINALQNK